MNQKTKRIISEVKSKGIKVMIPNLFTAFRMVGAFTIPAEMMQGNFEEAAALAALCGLSDAVDGKIARKLDAQTEFGAKFDQTVDKFFALGVIVPLLEKDHKWSIILLCEFAIAITNLKKEAKGITVKTTFQGKFKTVILFTTIILNYLTMFLELDDPNLKLFLESLFGASLAMEIITLASYLKDDEKVLKKDISK